MNQKKFPGLEKFLQQTSKSMKWSCERAGGQVPLRLGLWVWVQVKIQAWTESFH